LLVGATTTFAQQPGDARADLKNASGESVGMATFSPESGGVRLKAQVKGLPAGPHGIHVHAVGKCDGPDFMTAGGHFNPTSHQHGLNNPQGAHAGDMPNLMVASDGSGTIDALLKDASLGTGAGSLFGPEGTALVIHADKDDEVTDPTGNSGARIACGVIARTTGVSQSPPNPQPPVAQPSPAAKPAAPVPQTGGPLPPAPSPAAKPAAPAQAPAAQASPAAKPAAPAQAPAAVASPSALPRTGSALPLAETALPAALTGLGALVGGLALWRRRR
jgi:Cu-Zn family superoxide dismutase